MRFRRTLRFHGLKRPRLRQTWNKYNLYNIARATNPFFLPKTFFQQKWMAKAMTRAYHGEHIKERKWEIMFSRRLLSAVSMDAKYLAACDGSEQAAGRGSGRDVPTQKDLALSNPRDIATTNEPHRRFRINRAMTPYMQMTYAPIERRLDIAIFRAMFASSARQARQFVVHGAVKVNGMKMPHPGYLLNPSDMFQVDPEKVLFATGKQKKYRYDPEIAKQKRAARRSGEGQKASEVDEGGEEADSDVSALQPAAATEGGEEADSKAAQKAQTRRMKALLAQAKSLLADDTKDLSAKKKRTLRAFIKDLKYAMSHAGTIRAAQPTGSDAAQNMVDELSNMLASIGIESADSHGAATSNTSAKAADDAALSNTERNILERLIREEEENPWDPSKPYLTPWQPRPYMSAFAFIPRYLEVNHNICSAVYLRHPVARPGMAEVPTPFGPETNQLAFNWYLRRR